MSSSPSLAPLPDPSARATALKLLAAALAALAACVLLAALIPWIYPGEDARFALAWGDELGRLHVPDFDGPVPAKHPLTLLVGLLLAPLGAGAAIVAYGAISIASFALTGYAIFRLGEALGGATAGGIAAAIALTRPAVLEQLLTAGKDLPFAALVLLAAALVVADRNVSPNRVLVLLLLAGLLRPEAWLLAIAYWLWRHREAPASVLSPTTICLALGAPLIWAGLDLALTGDPIQTLHHGQGRAEELAQLHLGGGAAPSASRSGPALERLANGLDAGIPGAVGWGVVAGALITLAIAAARVRGRPLYSLGPLVIPLAIAAAAIAVSILAVVAGLALPARFLLLGALALVAVAASATRRRHRSRAAWVALIVAVAGTAAMVPADARDVRSMVTERETTSELGDKVLALGDRPRVEAAIAACPSLAAGGRDRGKVSLGQTLAALASGRDVSDFELGRSQLLRRRGSAFAYELGPEHPAFGRDLEPEERARTAQRKGPWTFASRC